MGADIHYCLERKNEEGHWEEIDNEFNRAFSYSLFSFLAGVRSESGGVVQFKKCTGIPKDSSIKGNDWYDSDYHSYTCYTYDELSSITKDQIIPIKEIYSLLEWVNLNAGKDAEPIEEVRANMTLLSECDGLELVKVIKDVPPEMLETVTIPLEKDGVEKHVSIKDLYIISVTGLNIKVHIFNKLQEYAKGMKELSKTEDCSDIRMIFSFDN